MRRKVTVGQATIVYDGDCPFCSRYVAMLRLRDTIGPVRLVNARDDSALARRFATEGIDLDRGMVLELNGETYHGADCMHRLALLSSPLGWFNRLNAMIFRYSAACKTLYPAMRWGRNAALALRSRPSIDSEDPTR